MSVLVSALSVAGGGGGTAVGIGRNGGAAARREQRGHGDACDEPDQNEQRRQHGTAPLAFCGRMKVFRHVNRPFMVYKNFVAFSIQEIREQNMNFV